MFLIQKLLQMGCSHGNFYEKSKNGKKKFLFPKKIETYRTNKPIYCMIPVDHLRVLLGVENEIKLLDITSIAPSTLFQEHKETFYHYGNYQMSRMWTRHQRQGTSLSFVWR